MTKILNILDSKFLKNESRAWPFSKDHAVETLLEGGTCTSLEMFLDSYKEMFLESYEFLEKQILDLDNWTYSDFVCSAFAYLYSDREPNAHSWCVVTEILMNNILTDDFLLFLKRNSFYNPARKANIVKGVGISFNHLTHPFYSVKCIRNVLNFIDWAKPNN